MVGLKSGCRERMRLGVKALSLEIWIFQKEKEKEKEIWLGIETEKRGVCLIEEVLVTFCKDEETLVQFYG